MATYYRIQWAGDPLSRSWLSQDVNSLDYEAGTSCCETLDELLAWIEGGTACPVGDVEIVEFAGEWLGTGDDGEAVVRPVAELSRWRHRDFRGAAKRATCREMRGGDLDDLADCGWERVDTLAVAD
jgi:hypothetical protein